MMKASDIRTELENLSIVQQCKGVSQNEWHRHDVYEHTVEVVRILEEELNASRELIAAGWLHDVGKPVTRVRKIDKTGTPILDPSGNHYHSFPKHEEKGEEKVREIDPAIFKRLRLNQDRVAKIVGFHFLPMGRIKEAKQDPTFQSFHVKVDQLRQDLTKTNMQDEVLTIFYADKASQKPSDLPLLRALREHLLNRETDLEKLFKLFEKAYPIKVPSTADKAK